MGAARPSDPDVAPAARHGALATRLGQSCAVYQIELSRDCRALTALPSAQRQAFLLQAEAGLSLEEIATQQGVGRETVKSRLRYALAKLRLELADVWP